MERCCVSDCNSTNFTHRLFNIPRNDNLRKLWLSFLIPYNVNLSGLSKEQLVHKRVCQKHFDRYQFDAKGDRLQHGYPCLFTEKEILYGIPLSSSGVNHLSDHTYSKVETEGNNESAIIKVNPEDDPPTGDHTYVRICNKEPTQLCSSLTTLTEAQAGTSSNSQYPNTYSGYHTNVTHDITKIVNKDKIAKDIKTSRYTARPIKRSNYIASQKTSHKLSDNDSSFIKTMKRKALAIQRSNKTFEERLEEAKEFSKRSLFVNNFKKLNKRAQDFLVMQLRLVDKKKKGRRFTDDEKLMSLSFMKESPKGYRIFQSQFILPTKRTINRLTQKISFNVGLNDNIFNVIKKATQDWDTEKKLCSVVFDEVALTPHLTFVEARDSIEGFKDLGGEREMKLTDHALVFMVRGVVSKWRQPITYYFCEGTTAAVTLKRILKEVIEKITQSGLLPIALVCDQGPTFRTALKMLKEETARKRILNNELNDGTIELANRKLNVVFDPPHLLKGIRNNLLSKDMIFKGKIASWDDIVSVYKVDCQLGGDTRMHKKLTDHHIINGKIKKMKVSVAAQVLSGKTSAMLKYTSRFKTTVDGEKVSDTMAATGEAVEFFDKLFDSVNGSKKTNKKGKLRGPIKSNSEHFEFWQDAKKILKDIKFIDANSKKAIKNKKIYHVRVPSLEGWITTLDSFQKIAKLLFEEYNIEYLYPRNINQDPLENFFGRIRAVNYRNINPDAYTFLNTFKSLLISNVMGPHSAYSNCEDDQGTLLVDFLKLLTDSDTSKYAIEENKENYSPQLTNQQAQQPKYSSASNPVVERVRVHSSAYTAGYICRKISKKFKCSNCKKTYLSDVKENFHEWIACREYKQLKNSNLAYPSKKFLLMYRDMSNFVHNFLNEYAYKKNIKKLIAAQINPTNFKWLGCTLHKNDVFIFCINLILRIHIHNWCNIMNKILKGDIEEKYVKKMGPPQIIAFNKYKMWKLRNKNK